MEARAVEALVKPLQPVVAYVVVEHATARALREATDADSVSDVLRERSSCGRLAARELFDLHDLRRAQPPEVFVQVRQRSRRAVCVRGRTVASHFFGRLSREVAEEIPELRFAVLANEELDELAVARGELLLLGRCCAVGEGEFPQQLAVVYPTPEVFEVVEEGATPIVVVLGQRVELVAHVGEATLHDVSASAKLQNVEGVHYLCRLVRRRVHLGSGLCRVRHGMLQGLVSLRVLVLNVHFS